MQHPKKEPCEDAALQQIVVERGRSWLGGHLQCVKNNVGTRAKVRKVGKTEKKKKKKIEHKHRAGQTEHDSVVIKDQVSHKVKPTTRKTKGKAHPSGCV